MSWRDYNKKKKNILEENDNKQNEQKFSRVANIKLPTKEQTERHPVNQQQYLPQSNTSEARNELNKINQQNMSTWNKVQNRVTQTMSGEYNKKNNVGLVVGNDVTQTVKNAVLGGAKGLVSSLGQTEFLSQQRNPEYKKAQAFATRINNQKDLETLEDKINYEKKNLDKATLVNGVLVRKQPDINESTTMKVFNKQQETLDKMIEKNTEQTRTKLGKFYAEQVAPSMGQSLVGTGLDLVAPRHGCWI